MTLNQRRVLYCFFILLFILFTPLIILYAAGYSLGNGFKVEKTGILIVNSRPSGARIIINGKVQKKILDKVLGKDNYISTPAKIKNLKPGEYDISLEKEAYLSWSKRLAIKPGESTYIEDVALFKNNIPEILLAGSFSSLTLSPDKKYLLAQNASSTAIYSLKNNKSQIFDNIGQDSDAPAWSPDSEKLIVNGRLIETGKEAGIGLDILESAQAITWTGGNEFIFGRQGNIYRYRLSDQTVENLISADFSSLLVNTKIYFTDERSGTLTIFDPNSKNSAQIALPGKNLVLKEIHNGLVSAYEPRYSILYLLDPESSLKPVKDTISNIKYWQWVANNRLLYANDHEIWLMNIKNGSFTSETLLTRISSQIEQVAWHPSDNYIIYLYDNQVNIIELDDRDKYNISTLASLPKIRQIALDESGRILYINAEIGSQKGIYRLNIQ